MTSHRGLYVTLIGLVIAAICALPLYFIGNLDPVSNDADMGIIVLYLSGMVGLTILALGLIIAAATALPLTPSIPSNRRVYRTATPHRRYSTRKLNEGLRVGPRKCCVENPLIRRRMPWEIQSLSSEWPWGSPWRWSPCTCCVASAFLRNMSAV